MNLETMTRTYSTRCPRRKGARYGVLTQLLPSGERLPVLIDHQTGIPLRMPLRFALKRRRAFGSAGTLATYLRRIGELYDWYTAHGMDLDAQIISGKSIQLGHLSRALVDLDQGLLRADAERRHAKPRGALPELDVFSPAPIGNARIHNLRVWLWARFLAWALRPQNWRGGRELHASGSREIWHDVLDELEQFRDDEYRTEGPGQRRSGLAPKELAALEAVLSPQASRGFSSGGFDPATTARNRMFYLLARWGGLRIGEILNLHVEDVPRVSSASPYLLVRRRVDDRAEPRLIAPAVKRRDRQVPLPDDVMEALQLYVKRERRQSRWPDLLLSSTKDMPLSYPRASDIAKQLRRYATTAFDAMYPGESHTLGSFSWHRLRHTRAREVLPHFIDFNDPTPQPEGLREFLDMFGWARESSAAPYIEELRQNRSAALVRQAMQSERTSSTRTS